MPRQAGSLSEIPHFNPDGRIAWGLDPADMRSRPAILVRMIGALMDASDQRTLFTAGTTGVAQGEIVLSAAGFTQKQIDDLGEQARQRLGAFKRLLSVAPFDGQDAARRIAARIAAAQRRQGAWDFKDIVTLSNAATVAFCLIEILALVLLTEPREAVA